LDRDANHGHPPSSGLTNGPPDALAIDQQLKETRSRIRDLGHEIDARKGTVARSMGGAVFFLLLAAGAAYDLITHNTALSVALGVTREKLSRIALGFSLVGLALLTHAVVRSRFSDRTRDAELARLEQDYADQLDRKDSISRDDS